MITLGIFYLHVVAAATLYTKRWQDSNVKEGILAVAFLLLVFSVGWSIATVIVKLFMDEKGLGIWFDRDTASLTLLTLVEGPFFYTQMIRGRKSLAGGLPDEA
jgi:hypothetical protein